MVYKLLTKAKGDYMKRKKEEKSCTQEACFMVEECTQIMQRQSFQLFRPTHFHTECYDKSSEHHCTSWCTRSHNVLSSQPHLTLQMPPV